MTKKDYEAIAGAIRTRRDCVASESDVFGEEVTSYADALFFQIENDLANVMAADNPRFDRARFLAACRGEDSKDSAGRKVKYA